MELEPRETTRNEAEARRSGNASATNNGKLSRIGDIAREFNVTLRALRFYEDRGMLFPKRVGNTRLYSQREKARLRLILLGRRVGFSLRDIKQMMDLYDPDGSNTRQLKVALEKSQKQMERLMAQRDAVEEAVSELAEAMAIVRGKLSSARDQANNERN